MHQSINGYHYILITKMSERLELCKSFPNSGFESYTCWSVLGIIF
jgi:hypothetical protein